MPYRVLTRDEHYRSPGPKRILALDGGGLRGILTTGYLQRIEDLLRQRHQAGPEFRLSHYFDLIAGTSTGAIIAAALAVGLSVAEVTAYYEQMGRDIFSDRQWFSRVLRDKYDKVKLENLLRTVLGADTTLGSEQLGTGVLFVTKRCDTGSPWPLGNNPEGKYFRAPEGAAWTSNADYPLWQVVRASTAAPTFFEPERIAIGEGLVGRFVDGGVSPHNNPALQAFMYATMHGYGINWPTGADRLLVVSLGTGSGQAAVDDSTIAAAQGINALKGLMTDNETLVETMMQWMSSSPTARHIDGEIGSLANDLLGGVAHFHYLRYNVELTQQGLVEIDPELPTNIFATLANMDETQNVEWLKRIGQKAAAVQIIPGHFPQTFDLA